MTRRELYCTIAAAALAFGAGAAPACAWAQRADTKTIEGTWEGPWYRGMSSGKAKFVIGDGGGTIELTNAESFGEGTRQLSKLAFDDNGLRFEAQGGSGPLSATLKLNDNGDQLKGMGKYEGFGVRFELSRTGR